MRRLSSAAATAILALTACALPGVAAGAGFSDGFESGTLSAWSATSATGTGSLTVTSQAARTGAYGLRISATTASGTTAYARHDFTARNDAEVAGWFRWTGDSGVNNSNGTGLRLFASGVRIADVFRQDANGALALRTLNAAGSHVYTQTGQTAPLNTWTKYSLRVVYNGPGAVSRVVVKVNDVVRIDASNFDLKAGNYNQLQIGTEHSQVVKVDVDDVTANFTVDPPPAGIAYQTSTTVNNPTATSSVIIATPANTAAGDLLVAQFAVNGGTAPGVPSGWSTLAAVTSPVSNPRLYAYYKVATASEPTSYTWTLPTAAINSGGISRYTGVSTASPLDTTVSTANGAVATTGTVPAVTTATAGAMVIGGMGINSGSATIAPPSGMTEVWETPAKANERAHATQTAAGTTGARTWTFSSGRDWAGYLTALRPA